MGGRDNVVHGALVYCMIFLLSIGIVFVGFLGLLLSSDTFHLHLQVTDKEPQVPCYFIFGDSLADDGNNNDLPTLAKSNYPPYGVDFPEGPTGRFTDGRLIVDIIAQLLGFHGFIPPFANLKGADILKGVNYASAASGIRDESGSQMGQVISMNKQLSNHFAIVSRIAQIMKSYSAANRYLGKCVYTVITGNNDYINNYFMPEVYPTSRIYTPQQFADVLAKEYSDQLQTLYSFGARKVAVFSAGQIGITPEMIARFGANSSASIDAVVQLFNDQLPSLVGNLNSQLSGAEFILIDTSDVSIDTDGVNVADTCCPTVPELGTCVPGSVPCSNRSEYVFFDGFHTTEVVNEAYAKVAYEEMSLFYNASAYGGVGGISRPAPSWLWNQRVGYSPY
ncbi:hypothetical protein SAY86_027688 [Trapa natans]|uniref:GDSL esterase/lipase n=1 Tax=Trapa natans TaxID=22666 RepID=A0AAN7KS50_TRANT|nr:hypothetical protein SAY86_027688 [Trapa natans]